VEVEALKAQRNRVSKEIGALMAQRKGDEAESKKRETREIGERITDLDKTVAAAELERDHLLLRIPNLPNASVPEGKTAEDNQVVRTWGAQPAFEFKPKSHLELCESLGLVDFSRGSKLSGSGFLLYTGFGAKLERALIQFLLDLHTTTHGYTEVSPPYIITAIAWWGLASFRSLKTRPTRCGRATTTHHLASFTCCRLRRPRGEYSP